MQIRLRGFLIDFIDNIIDSVDCDRIIGSYEDSVDARREIEMMIGFEGSQQGAAPPAASRERSNNNMYPPPPPPSLSSKDYHRSASGRDSRDREPREHRERRDSRDNARDFRDSRDSRDFRDIRRDDRPDHRDDSNGRNNSRQPPRDYYPNGPPPAPSDYNDGRRDYDGRSSRSDRDDYRPPRNDDIPPRLSHHNASQAAPAPARQGNNGIRSSFFKCKLHHCPL